MHSDDISVGFCEVIHILLHLLCRKGGK